MPFHAPSVAPVTDEEEYAFMELESIISSGELSSAIGWAIGCGSQLADRKGDILEMCHFSGRVLKNWGTVLFFLDQVREDNMIATSVTMLAGHCMYSFCDSWMTSLMT